MKKIKVAIMGGTGYAAGELIRILLRHPQVELTNIASIDHVGKNIGQIHRNFGDRLPFTFQNLSAEECAKGADLVFLTLPHKVSFTKVPEFLKLGVRIVDFSGDYRLQDPAVYKKYYEHDHTNPENLEKFIYGLPELQREKIKGAEYVSNPGCFPTATAMSLLPLAHAGLLKGKVRVCGPTGSSGSGVAPQEGTHHPVRSLNLKSYKILNHQHQPEMEQTLAFAGAKDFVIDFIPMSAPLSRGILINSFCDLPASMTGQDVQKLYKDFYSSHPFVRVLPYGTSPEVVAVAGSNYVDLAVTLSDERLGSKTFAAVSAIDNLIKGAAGQAVQNMNLMFGFDEKCGIDDFGTWP